MCLCGKKSAYRTITLFIYKIINLQQPIFITGIGTGVGKTVIAAIVTEALQANYWKPIQAGFDDGTDSELVDSLISNTATKILPEVYKLKKAASPHIAAKEEDVYIDVSLIVNRFSLVVNHKSLDIVIEGAGGILVPLNNNEFVVDLIKKLNAKVILVSKNYLGSINHSLLTAAVCKQNDIDVFGWIFNGDNVTYEDEIVEWSGYKKLGSIPLSNNVDKGFVKQQAAIIKPFLKI
jgi:dethiobiotin synthetase